MNHSRSRLEILVDEVVVRGLSPDEARSAVAALEVRLQLIGENWATSNTAIAPRDEAFPRPQSVMPTNASSAAIGESAASVVWRAIAGGNRP